MRRGRYVEPGPPALTDGAVLSVIAAEVLASAAEAAQAVWRECSSRLRPSAA